MKLQDFLRLRKQQDVVKIIILYGIAIGVCFGFLIRDGLRYAEITHRKEEFRLLSSEPVLTDTKVQRVREIDGVTAVSYELQDTVTVQYQTNTASFEAALLSEAYLQQVYGITQESSMMTYYANDAAYRQLLQSLSENGTSIRTDEIVVTYRSEQESTGINSGGTISGDTGRSDTASQGLSGRSARIVRMDIGGDTPFVCTLGEPVILKSSGTLRIQIARQDQSTKILALASNLSFSNDNALEIYQAQAKLEHIYMQIKFELLLIAVCLVAVFTLRKYAVRPLEK